MAAVAGADPAPWFRGWGTTFLSVSLGWCPPAPQVQVILSTMELARTCPSASGFNQLPECRRWIRTRFAKYSPKYNLHLVQTCLRHHSDMAKPTTDFSAKDPNNMCNRRLLHPRINSWFLETQKWLLLLTLSKDLSRFCISFSFWILMTILCLAPLVTFCKEEKQHKTWR